MAKPKPISDEMLLLVADKFRLLGDPTRLAILRCLMNENGEMNVGQIALSTGCELANVSKHLRQLADARLLSRRRKGAFVLYGLHDPVVEKICALVCDSLQRELESQVKRNRRLLRQKR